MYFRTAAALFLVASALLGAAVAQTDAVRGYRVIVHPDNPIASAERKFIADAFLKKKTRWADDRVIRPVDLGAKSSVRRRFSQDVVKRSVTAVRSYWRQIIYSGRGVPPPELDSDDAVVSYVKTHRAAIGYVSTGAKVEGVKVLDVK